MARPPDRRDAPRSGSGRSGSGRSGSGRSGSSGKQGRGRTRDRDAGAGAARGAGRDRANEGGFGPYGAPQDPERERRADEAVPERPPARLRVKGDRGGPGTKRDQERARRTGRSGGRPSGTASSDEQPRARRRRGRAPDDVEQEILRLGGRRGEYLLREVMAAADAYAHQRDREALRRLRPVRDAIPDSPTVRELLGLAHYRLGNYRAAATELGRFVEMSDSVEQHPVLMDCYRAQRRWRRVDELWAELAATSPSAELVTEGRIVAAGALADRGRLDEAIAVLDRKGTDVRKPKLHHLRLWYALADLEDRAGNHARARSLFDRIAAHDREFADVGARRAALH